MKFIELFAGIGLVRLGMEAAGWECVYANDLDPQKEETYRLNFQGNDFHLEDIWNIELSDLPDEFQMITASFPCVDLSLAGNRKGLAGKESGTFWAFVKILKSLKTQGRLPRLLMIENVLGFLNSHGGKDFYDAIRALNDIGYDTDAVVLDANHFTPQSRKRLFILGVHKSVSDSHMIKTKYGLFDQWSHVLSENHSLRPEKLKTFMLKTPELKWGLFDFPLPPPLVNNLEEIIENMSDSDNRWWNKERVDKLVKQMNPNHRKIAMDYKEADIWSYGTIYSRMRKGSSCAELRTDGVAGCLRTPRGGSSKQILLKAGYGTIKIRHLTPREYARLQGVPDNFENPPKDTQAYFGYGDAVCVPAITWLAENALNACMSNSDERKKEEKIATAA